MQRKIQLAAMAAATLIAGTAGAFAQGYARYGDSMAWGPGPGYAAGPAYSYDAVPPQPMYYGGRGWYGGYGNGTSHPTPSSTQGDVGPQGNNNGTVTGVYRYQRW
ncbi:hypothetical protein ACQR1W_01010 [Bradyrhizobium sp. HKCCYLS1011]|uniref:hypothetical protein n=1 Tax=Bradyrhizobium sp. HKCCYLS1011 TaxID=3420733 RepID=UPI003EBBB3DC